LLSDVFKDRLREEVGDVEVFGEATADLGGGKGGRGDVEGVEPEALELSADGVEGGEGIAGTRDEDETGELDQLGGAVPPGEIEGLVGAEDEEELGVGSETLTECGEGVESVGGARAIELEVFDFGAREGPDGELGHAQAVLGRGDGQVGTLVGRGLGRDEEEEVEGELIAGGGGDGQVGVVDGVEGSAQDADTHDEHLKEEETFNAKTQRAQRTAQIR